MDELLQTNYAVDTFYLLVMGVLVMFMAPGFTMLEAGMVRARNTTEILTKNVGLYSIACIMYMLCGYYIMYSSDAGSFLPNLGFLIGEENAVQAVSADSDQGSDHSLRARHFFQVLFVATSMSIVSGAVAERMKLWPFFLFAVVMTGFIYPVQGFWSWGGGFLEVAGFSDFAGAGVVHMCGAAAALAGVLVLGPRKGKYGAEGQVYAIPGANLPLATLGMFMLWFGWFGFNGGSHLMLSSFEAANAIAQVFVNTNIAAAAGLLTALVLARLFYGKADLTMGLNGALAGLVSITAEPLTPSIQAAAMIGAVGGFIALVAIVTMDRLKVDDPVGAISVHGAAAIWGLIAVPLTNSDASFLTQIYGIVVIFGWVFVTSLVVWAVLKAVIGIRVSEEEEIQGIDRAECGIDAYPEFVGRQ